MKFNFKYIFIVMFCAILTNKINAQESITNEINYVLLDTLIEKAKINYPRARVLAYQTEMAKNNINKAKVSWLDAFNFNYIYGNNSLFNLQNPSSLINGYQASINVNLGFLLDKPLKVKNAKVEHKIALLEEDQYTLTITNEVKKRYFTYLQFLSSVKVRSKAVSDATTLANDLKYKYERGEVTFQIYNNALISLAAVEQSKIESEGGLFVAKASIEELIGLPLQEVINEHK